MPTGIPVATVAINGGANAAILAAKILATSDDALLSRLKAYTQEMKEEVEAKDAKLKEVGYKNYTCLLYTSKVVIDDTLKAAIDAYYEQYGAK